jgi:hypothetical protein
MGYQKFSSKRFGEVVDIVSDETDVEMYWINTEDPQNF